jgi:hypothetical protein
MIKERGGKSLVVEVLILLTATAAGASGIWYCLGTKTVHVEINRGIRKVFPSLLTFHLNTGMVAGAAGVLLAAWSLALVVIARRRRRSGLEASTRSPGLAACSAATTLSALYLGIHLIKVAFLGWPVESLFGTGGGLVVGGWFSGEEVDGFAAKVLPDLTRAVAPLALGALVFSIMTLRRRPKGWVEWGALAVGLGWVVAGLLVICLPPGHRNWFH